MSHDDDLELFQDIERARREETDGLLDPLSPVSHDRCPDLLWVSSEHLSHYLDRYYYSEFSLSDKMAMVAHLVGIDQLGYEKELGMTPSVSFLGHLHFAFHHIFSPAGHEE